MRCPNLSQLPPPPAGKTGWPWTESGPVLPDSMPDGSAWPRVSVITPSYNQGQYIEETIRSVLLQGYPDLEYIVVDGGSSDESLDIIRKYELWMAGSSSEPDRGQTHAINKGWARATGELAAYINTDDCYMPSAIAEAALAFRAEPDAGMLYGSAIVVDEMGKELRTWQAHPFDLKRMLTVGNSVPQPAAFFATSALKTVGYLDEVWQMIMDYELCIRLGMQFPAVCLVGVLARFRDHSQSKTRIHFDVMARELIRFVLTLQTNRVPVRKLESIKRGAFSRIYYEWALAYLAQGRRRARVGLRPFLRSLIIDPTFALARPLETSFVIKELLLAHLASARSVPNPMVKVEGN